MFKGPVDFYFFSGTGNTLLVVNKMCETFEKNGIDVNIHRIENSNPEEVNTEHTIGLGFPIAELSTYDFVWNFVKSLPQTSADTDIFMVDTLAGFSGGIVGQLREIVKKKGYNPIGAKEIVMPPNFLYLESEEACTHKVEKGLVKAEKYSVDLIDERSKWGRIPILADSMYLFSMGLLKLTEMKLNQKLLYLNADKEKCNKCGTCVELCPIDNIMIGKDGYPENLMHCVYCLRCTSFCPKRAIPNKITYKGKTYQAVKVKEFLKDDVALENEPKPAISVRD